MQTRTSPSAPSRLARRYQCAASRQRDSSAPSSTRPAPRWLRRRKLAGWLDRRRRQTHSTGSDFQTPRTILHRPAWPWRPPPWGLLESTSSSITETTTHQVESYAKPRSLCTVYARMALHCFTVGPTPAGVDLRTRSACQHQRLKIKLVDHGRGWPRPDVSTSGRIGAAGAAPAAGLDLEPSPKKI